MANRRGPASWNSFRSKVLITALVIVAFRLGSAIPTPGVNVAALGIVQHQLATGGALSFLNLLSGGTLGRLSLLTLGISPYIIATMLIQLLGSLIPSLKVGATSGVGTGARAAQLTRYLTLPIAAIEAVSLMVYLRTGNLLTVGPFRIPLITHFTPFKAVMIVVIWVIGAAIVMWFAELISQRGLGSGTGVLILVGALAGLPGRLNTFYQESGALALSIFMVIIIAAIAGIIFVDQGQRRIPIRYTRLGSAKAHALSYLPLKLNKAGIMPAIFATAFVALPPALGNLLPSKGFLAPVSNFLKTVVSSPDSMGYIIFVAACVIGFTVVFNAVTFDADDVAEGLAREGAFVPGLRPGPDTANYVERTLRQVGVAGALMVTAMALLPSVTMAIWHLPNFPVTGTSILLLAMVSSDLVMRLRAEAVVARYERAANSIIPISPA
jgi:preprotein translocase subunit SecY